MATLGNLGFVQRTETIEKYNKVWSPDRAILLLGAAGAGKSSFVNFVAGEHRTEVGNGFYSITANSAFWDMNIGGQQLRMIDLPGSFDPGRNKVVDPSDDG